MTHTMKWRSEFTGEEGEFVWDNTNEDMTIWEIGLIRQEAIDKAKMEEEERQFAVLEFYRAFIRGQH